MSGERTPTELTDEELAKRAQRDPAEFAPLYRRYVRPIYAFCYQRLSAREPAEDATSQTFVQAIAALPAFQARSFRAWLYAIARNVVTDMQRARPMVSLERDFVSPGPTPADAALAMAGELDVRRLLDGLTPEQRDVVELRLSGLKGPEIAEALGRSPGAVRALQFRAYQRLRAVLDPNEVPK